MIMIIIKINFHIFKHYLQHFHLGNLIISSIFVYNLLIQISI
jgi:hypothetical protein